MTTSVLVFGTFDLLHPGHLKFLREARRYGPVTVALTTDRLCRHYKGQPACHPFLVRRQRLESLNLVSRVVPADDTPGQFSILTRLRPKTIVTGYDQGELEEAIRKKISAHDPTLAIVRLKPYRSDVYRSSSFRRLKNQRRFPQRAERLAV